MQCPRSRLFRIRTMSTIHLLMTLTASVFRYAKDNVLLEDLQNSHKIKRVYYVNLLRLLRNTNRTKRRGKLSKSVLCKTTLQHNLISMAAVRNFGFVLADQQPCFTYLATPVYHLFFNMKKHLWMCIVVMMTSYLLLMTFLPSGLKSFQKRDPNTTTPMEEVRGYYVEK